MDQWFNLYKRSTQRTDCLRSYITLDVPCVPLADPADQCCECITGPSLANHITRYNGSCFKSRATVLQNTQGTHRNPKPRQSLKTGGPQVISKC
eukprot:6294119-Amphidinium_carterae.1